MDDQRGNGEGNSFLQQSIARRNNDNRQNVDYSFLEPRTSSLSAAVRNQTARASSPGIDQLLDFQGNDDSFRLMFSQYIL